MHSPNVTDRAAQVSAFFGQNPEKWRLRYTVQHGNNWEYQARGRIALEWLAELRQAGGRRLLEIGCRVGVQSIEAARQGWEIVATDFVEALLADAQRQSREPMWVAAAAEALPFTPHAYDAVLMTGIGYLDDPPQALTAVREQLRPGGRLIISWVSPLPLLMERMSRIVSWVPDTVYMGLKRLVTRHAVTAPAEPPSFYQEYLRRWRPEEFYPMLTSAGFAIDRVRSQNFGRFRFMDHPLLSERTDIRLSTWLERLAGTAPHRRLHDGARAHIALATAR